MIATASRTAAFVLFAVVLGVSLAGARVEGRAPSARERYEGALALEREARTATERGAAGEAQANKVARRAIVLYESVVRRFPTSGYCDNALMRGGDLARWLYTRSGRAADRSAAEKYYGWLVREYPTSGLRAQARAAARSLVTAAPGPARRAAAASADPGPAATTSRSATTPAVTSPAAPASAPAPTLRGIERDVVNGAVRVTLLLDREARFSHDVLDGPRRAFVDLFGAEPTAELQDAALRYDGEAVRQVRVGRQPDATRVVLDLAGDPAVSVFALYNPFRIVIDAERALVSGTAAPPVAAAVLRDEVPAAPRDENDVVPALAESALPAPAPVAPSPAPAAVPSPVPSTPTSELDLDVALNAPVPSVPAANGDGTFSLARQLGLGISRIVIDPGHGGHDPGTLTPGSSEARLVLDVALRLERLLKKEPGLEVVLTRRTDVFIPLERRTAIANREGADLFLSIHANASRNTSARGLETYYLSFASNPEAEAVAARENAASSSDMHNLPNIVRAIALNNKLDESRDLANAVQQTLTGRLAKNHPGVRSRGVKKAPFVVLIGAAMPSVLAEIGFITNKQEAALVKTPAYRQRIAEGLHAAILQYRRSLKRQMAVATR